MQDLIVIDDIEYAVTERVGGGLIIPEKKPFSADNFHVLKRLAWFLIINS